ncbi:MAG: hypothetical protein AB1599_05635 [Planctomycetota bacterium]
MPFPKKDDDFFNFQGKVNNDVVINQVPWNIPPAEVAALTARRAAYEPLYHKSQEKENRTSADVLRHRQMRKTYEKELRVFIKAWLMFNPLVSDDQRKEMSIPVWDKEPTPISPDYVVSLAPPLLLLDWSKQSQVTVHFGVNPSNEKQNAKPVNISGAKIWYRIETGPWQFVADDTNSPYLHNLAITEPQNVEYRAQWFDKKMRLGVFGKTVGCIVNP